jgi:hypothetical protein
MRSKLAWESEHRDEWLFCLTVVNMAAKEFMTRRPRRNHTPALKAKVALAALVGEPPDLDAFLK